jgi:hypothetical protein
VSMNKKDDPSTIFEQVNSINNRYNTTATKMEEVELTAVVISAAPVEYQAVLTTKQLSLGVGITVEDLRTAMNAHWRSIGGINGKREESDEWVLNASTGYCFECKERGHKAHECSQKKSNGGDERVSMASARKSLEFSRLLGDFSGLIGSLHFSRLLLASGIRVAVISRSLWLRHESRWSSVDCWEISPV